MDAIQCVSAKTAQNLLYGLDSGQHTVNISSTVSAVSEIIRIKGDSLLLIKLLPRLNIIVKKLEKLDWHRSVVPQSSCYVFTGLRPTTLHKGGSRPYRVYTVTSRSQLLLGDHCHVIMVSQQDWLCNQGCTGDIGDLTTDAADQNVKVISYKGAVTGILDETLGVYELDGKVRLFTSLVPAVHKYLFLTSGVQVTLYNVHAVVNPEDSLTSLFCCMYSCIKTNKVPNKFRQSVGVPPALQARLYLHGVAHTQLGWMFTTRAALYRQLGPANRRLVEAVFCNILGTVELCGENYSSYHRNLLDEFLKPKHDCCLLQTHLASDPPRLMSVGDVLRHTETDEQQQQQQGEQYWRTHVLDSQPGQIVIGILNICLKSGHPTLKDNTGCIDICVTGRHGDADVCHSNHCCDAVKPSCRFICPLLNSCCVGKIVSVTKYRICHEYFHSVCNMEENKRRNPTKSYEIKYLIFSLSDAIIIGNSQKRSAAFTIPQPQVTVTSSNCDQQKLTSCIREVVPENKNYEMIEDKERVQINADKQNLPLRHDSRSETEVKPSNLGTLHRHERDSGGVYYCRKMSCIPDRKSSPFLVNAVLPSVNGLVASEARNSDSCKYSHDCNSSNSPEVCIQTEAEDRTGENHCQPPVMDNQTKQTSADKEGCSGDYVRLTGLLDNRTRSSCIVCVRRKEGIRLAECSATSLDLSFCILAHIWNNGTFGEETLFELKGPSVQWYPIIHPGHLYRLTSSDSSVLLKNRQTNTMVQKFIERSKAQTCFVVHPNVQINTIFGDNLPVLRCPGIEKTDIAHILSERCCDTFVTFDGVICGRGQWEPDVTMATTAKTNQGRINVVEDKLLQIGISTLDNRCVRLQVKSQTSTHEIQVYLNVENLSYPLGLLPGVHVHFCQMERRVSRVGNVYCRYLPVSMVTALGFGPVPRPVPTVTSSSAPQPTAPQLPLVEACRAPPRSASFCCVADVHQVLKLSLKCVCSVCSAAVSEGRCSNMGCRNQAYRFVTRASVLVSDGTAVAMAMLSGTTVQSMLQLSSDQWACLEAEVGNSGEIFVQQSFPAYGSALEKYMYILCDNRLVKKPWTMTLKHRYIPPDKESATEQENLGIDDFVLKRISTGSGEIMTRCLPFLQLECLALDRVDINQCITRCLPNMSD